MGTFSHKGKVYEVDSMNFLTNCNDWDENFAEGLAPQLSIPRGLTKEHWEVIKTIRKVYMEEGDFPNVYETCSVCGLRIPELRKLFPTGYWRGACKLAGVISWGGPLGPVFHPVNLSEMKPFIESYDKTYEIDVRGFLVNPDNWDEYYAVYKAYEMKIHEGKLSDRHWKIIKFLRESYQQNKEVPTIYETCEVNQIDMEELEQLFPDGYHRGAVKLAGLRISGPHSKKLKVT
jgi:tRNA 2-thiouridine synthesizing protein E